eukprot:4875745-Pleurochrysis_carterae.AAC.4
MKERRDRVAPAQGDVREQPRLISVCEGKQRSRGRDRRLTSGDGRENLELHELMVTCGSGVVHHAVTQGGRQQTLSVGSMKRGGITHSTRAMHDANGSKPGVQHVPLMCA